MDINQAVEVLQYAVETEDEKEALVALVKAAQKGLQGDVASYKQLMFINKMAKAAEIDLGDTLDSMDIHVGDDIRKMTKKEASKVIKEFLARGYKELLG